MKLQSYIKFPKLGAAPRPPDQIPWRLPQLCASYGWPTGLAGGGRTAIVELGGGWAWSDVGQFCGGLGIPTPNIGDFSVDGAMNSGDLSDPASAEVALDIQVAAASYFAAAEKPATIRMYWAQNSAEAITQAIIRATADGCDTFSCSWGARESLWGTSSAMALEAAAAAAAAKGMVTFAAAGDNDSSDSGTRTNVDLPAAAPHVIGCGGTMRPHNSNLSNPETVWNETPGNPSGEGTGGGFSRLFPMPGWQLGAPHGSRMVPDIAACADPETGYHIVLNGQDAVVGGTSAVAPLMAGLFAAFGAKLGFVSPALWTNQVTFNDVIQGDNGFYRAMAGPDPCSGLGSPRGAKIATLFTSQPGQDFLGR
jgi:subtilase family serine protease